MHTFNETAAGVPAFLAKLWRLVEDPETDNLIYWRSDGRSFIIQNQAQFARELLPLNYKHNNMASFIRQLNMYGFHKITSIDNGGLKFDKDEMEFSHPCFQKDHPYLLEHIKRKIANPKPVTEEKTLKPETITKVIGEVKVMRGRQDTLDSRFSAMKQENEALWREIAVLRQKHIKQQQIVNKLIQFLVTIVQPTRAGGSINTMSGVKRRFQLMINNVPESESAKIRKTNEDTRPVIHELTEDLFDEVNYDADMAHSPNVLSPDLQSNHGNDADEISSPIQFKVESNTNTEEDELIHENCGDNIDYIIEDIVPETDEWLENNVFSPQQLINNDDVKQHNIEFIPEQYRHGTTSDTDQNIANQKNIKTKQKKPGLYLKLNNGKQAKIGGKIIPSSGSTSGVKNGESNLTGKGKNSPKAYTNKDDFISAEIPNELFDIQDGSASQLISAIHSSGSFNPTLSEDYRKKLKASGSKNLAVTKYNNKNQTNDEAMRLSSPEDVGTHLDNIQNDLDTIKDFFKGEDYSLDPNALLGNSAGGTSTKNRLLLSPTVDSELFSKIFGELDVPYGLSLNSDFPLDKRNDENTASGSELMTYQPYNLDLTEFLNPNPTLDTDKNDDEEYASKELNTPSIDRNRISFKTK